MLNPGTFCGILNLAKRCTLRGVYLSGHSVTHVRAADARLLPNTRGQEKIMEVGEIRRELKEKLADAEKILIGIGAEWEEDGTEKERILKEAFSFLLEAVSGKDYFVITTLNPAALLKRGFEKTHMVAPLDVSLTEDEWDGYMKWLAGTLNRKTVLLELGENFLHPTIIRWPFEKMAFINKKACLYRVHKKFYQITDELKEKAAAVKEDSVLFMAEWSKEEKYGSN